MLLKAIEKKKSSGVFFPLKMKNSLPESGVFKGV